MADLLNSPYVLPAAAFVLVAGGLTYYPMDWQRETTTGKIRMWAQPMVLGAAAAVVVYYLTAAGVGGGAEGLTPGGITTLLGAANAATLPIDKY